MFWPAKESLVTGSTITSVLPDVVSPMATAGESSAKSMNSRPFTGRFTIWRSVMTVLTSVRVGSTNSEVAATSTFSSSPPGVSVKSSSAACPICKTTFFVCLPKPVNSTDTVYSPAGSAGTEYSPESELCTVLEKPVAALATVTLTLDTLPPEVSTTRPDSVAVMACPRTAGQNPRISARKKLTNAQTDFVRFITPHPRFCAENLAVSLEYTRAESVSRHSKVRFVRDLATLPSAWPGKWKSSRALVLAAQTSRYA